MATARSAAVAVAAVLVAALTCTAFAGVSAITTKPSAGAAIIQTTLQVFPTLEAKGQQQPSFAARYWQKQRDIVPSADEDDVDSAAPHKLSAAQQEHILEDIRRHNHQQQWWTAPGSAGTAAPSPTVNTEAIFHDDGAGKDDPDLSPVNDQLEQLLQINDVAATDDDVTTVDSQDDDRHGKQRSIGNGGGSGGWHPQASQPYGRPQQQQQQQQHPSLSPYVPPPPTVQQHAQHPQNQHQQQYYPTTSAGATVPHHHHHQQQKQQVFVTTPSSPSSTQPSAAPSGHRHSNQQYVQQLQYYPKQQQRPTAVAASTGIVGPDGGELDPDIEQQIRQQLTAVVGAGGGNYTILTSPTGGQRTTPSTRIAGSASSDHLQYVQIGGGTGSGVLPLAPSRNRVQQPQPTESGTPSSITANRNTVVKTVVVRQKPSPQPAAVAPPAVAAAKVAAQQTWSASEQQQLEQLARQVLPPGVAQYEIIRAGGIDGDGKSGVIGDPVAAATVGTPDDSVPAGGMPQQSVLGKKKPVTFVILEERPDGTVRVRGVEKKQHGVVDGGAPAGGGDAAADQPGPVAADDEQLQQLVDRLNRGELRLPGAGPPPVSKSNAADSATAASTTAATPLPAYVPTFASTVSPPPSPPPPPKSNGGYGITKHRDSSSPSAYFSTVKPQPTTSTSTAQQQQYQNFFLPTAVPTASVSVTTTVGQQNRYHHQQHQQQQQQYYSTPAIATSASSSTPRPANSTLSYHNSNNNKSAKEGVFSGALRRRGYYAMAKYMRQAGVDSVLEETGPFTVFVPTDKAFRALLVQLGGPDRAEDKFRENPRLLIGLLLHHVVPGAFKAADLMAGDEMTGVSLAGTQLRANLYARQLYDNRWNDIEVLTVNGARVLDNVVPAASVTTDDGSSADDGGSVGPVQQRRDMVLSSGGDGGGLGGAGENQQIMAIGHAVDRVLFPLPVGDVLATMRADRQRRYSVFLRAVDEHCSSSVRSMLTGSRTLTVFAPMDEAFRVRRGSGNHTSSSGSIVDWLLREDAAGRFKKRNRRRIADRFVLSHMVMAGPGDPPMYTAGLRFYQVRDTAYRLPDGAGESSAPAEEEDEGTTEDSNHDRDDGFTTLPPVDGEKPRFYQLTVYKDSGKIRLNGGAAQVLVRNVPATNGVLHGLDAPLV